MTSPSSSNENILARVSTGAPGLDAILGGGFVRGGIYMLQGNPGAGKTILTNQLCFHHVTSTQESSALFVTLLAENHARMMDNIRKMSFFDDSKIPGRLTYLSAFHQLREEGLGGVTAVLRREVQRRHCSMLVLDGVLPPRAGSASDQDFKEFVHSLQEIALATDCTMLMTGNVVAGEVSPEQTMVDGLIRLNDRTYGWRAESDLQVVKFRGSAYLRGRHAYKITDDGLLVYPRVESLSALHPACDDSTQDGRTSIGISTLDSLLGGGLPTASTTMVMGPTGTGKTTMGLQFLARSSNHEPGLLFGFYETPARLRARARVMSQPLAALMDTGVVEIMWQPPSGNLLDAYAESLLAAIRRRQVRRLFIDGLGGFIKAGVDPTRMDHFFSALANQLRALGVTTIYSLELPDILGPAVRVPINDLSSIAENMLLMRFVEARSKLSRLLSILKVRNSDFDPSLRAYTITGDGIVIESPDGTEAIVSGAQTEGALQAAPVTKKPGGD